MTITKLHDHSRVHIGHISVNQFLSPPPGHFNALHAHARAPAHGHGHGHARLDHQFLDLPQNINNMRVQRRLNPDEVQMVANQAMTYFTSSVILMTLALVYSDPNPLFLRGQLGGLFGNTNARTNQRASEMMAEGRYSHGAGSHGGNGDRFANGAGYMGHTHGHGQGQGHSNGAGYSGGGHNGNAHRGSGYTGGGHSNEDNRGSGYSGGGRYGDHHGSGHMGGHGQGHGNDMYGQGHYGHGGGGGNYGHGEAGGVNYNGGNGGVGVNANAISQQPIGLKAGLKSLLFGVKGRMKSAYFAMKKALKAMFLRGELGGGTPTNNNNNYAGNYGYDRNSPGRRVTEAIEFGRQGNTFLRINWKPESSYGGWPKWLRFLG